jgi:hypothetical protein
MRPRAVRARLLVLAHVALLALAVSLGCKPSSGPAPSAGASATAAAKAYPTSVAQADELKKGGASWTNEEIRVYYNQVVSTIGPSNEQWKRDGVAAEERARRAFTIRHDARLTCRAMMASPSEVEDLRKRDQEKYGQPDGPTFEQLVENGRKTSAAGDAVYEGIIASSQRTDGTFNRAFGIKR